MKRSCFLSALLTLMLILTSCVKTSSLNPAAPVTLTLWHVYGEQAESPMNRLIEEFNLTVGREKGVVIDVTLMSNSVQIGQHLLDAQANKPGSAAMPDLFFAHLNNAAALGTDSLLNWKDLFSQEDLSGYVDAFVQEGMVGDALYVFPVSKSTHMLFVNGTQFARFSAATGTCFN